MLYLDYMNTIYTIHDCKPTIVPETKKRDESSLMTGDMDFIDDNKPRPVNYNILKIPSEEIIEDHEKKKSNTHTQKKTDDSESFVKPLASSMDKICRKKCCKNINICSQIVWILATAKNRKDIESAESILEKAYTKK